MNKDIEIIGGPIEINGDDPIVKYRHSDGSEFWAYNPLEVFYSDERMFAALDMIESLQKKNDDCVRMVNGYMDAESNYNKEIERLKKELESTNSILRGVNAEVHQLRSQLPESMQDILLRLSLKSDDVSKLAYEEITSLRQRVEELEDQITELPTIIRRYQKDAEHWRDLLSHQKFNNKAVGYAINRTKERMADKRKDRDEGER